jgi:hypothetical protein
MISASVKDFFSARWREAMAGISADADGGETTPPNAIAANAIVKICENRLIAATLPQSAQARKAYQVVARMERSEIRERW